MQKKYYWAKTKRTTTMEGGVSEWQLLCVPTCLLRMNNLLLGPETYYLLLQSDCEQFGCLKMPCQFSPRGHFNLRLQMQKK